MTLDPLAVRRLRRDLKTHSFIAALAAIGAAVLYGVTSLSTPSLVSAQTIRPTATLSAQAQVRTTIQLTPQSAGVLDSYAEATRPGATAVTFRTWLQRVNATTSLRGTDTVVRVALSFLSTGAPPVGSQDAVGVAAGCFSVCPSNPRGSYTTKFGKVVGYECTGLEGCAYDKVNKRWRCSYRTCSFIKSATIIP